MRRALLLALTLALAPAPGMAQAQTAPVSPPTSTVPAKPKPPAALVGVTITTTLGPIVIAVEKERAPITAANFLKYVDQKRLDGVVFYRTVRVQPNYGFIQFGTQNDPKRTLPPIPHEPTTKTGLSHVDGAISMAMLKPGTASGDFFIIVGDTKPMDATATDPGYAVFGRVVSGMDVVHRILDSPTSPTKGVGIMKGQMLEPTFKVMSVRRSALPSAALDRPPAMPDTVVPLTPAPATPTPSPQ